MDTVNVDSLMDSGDVSSVIVKLAHEFIALREEYDEVKKKEVEAKTRRDDAKMNLYNQMTVEDVSSIKIADLGTFSQSFKPWAKIIDMDKATAYLRELGIYDQIMELKPKAARLNELMRDKYIDKRQPIPEEAIGIAVKVTPTVAVRRG